MKSSDLMRKRNELEKKEEEKLEKYRKKCIRNETKEKKECSSEYIKHIIRQVGDPDSNDAKNSLLLYMAKNASMNEDNKSGMVPVTDKIYHYKDRNGRYQSLFPDADNYWPDKDQCLPTNKIKPVDLKTLFQSIEKLGNMECWWGCGYISHTSYNLNVRVSRQLIMHFKLKE